MAGSWLGGRIEASTWTLGLLLGDLAMIGLFVAVGEVRHGGTLAAGLETYGQFLVGWALVSVPAGVYAPRALAEARRAVVSVLAAWVLAAIVGVLVRSALRPGGVIQLSFVAVTIGFGGAFLAAWRFVAVRAVERP